MLIWMLFTHRLSNASVDSLAPGGFLHSEYFILIDKQGRVRSGIDKNGNAVGAYDGTNEVQMKDLNLALLN